ncbi:unnamed protein product, partial [Allacma fusca]
RGVSNIQENIESLNTRLEIPERSYQQISNYPFTKQISLKTPNILKIPWTERSTNLKISVQTN